MIGAVALALGVFMPIVTFPMVGAQNYFQNGQGDGTVILALAVVALLVSASGHVRWAWVPGLLSAAVTTLGFVRITSGIGEMRRDLEADLAGNPFAGLGELAMQSVQLQWGWVLLFGGSIALVVAGARQWSRHAARG